MKESNETETRNEDGEPFLPSPTRFLNVTDRRYRGHQAPRRRRTVARSTPTPTVAARNSTVGINVLNAVNPVANYRYVARPLLERRVRKRAVDNFQIQTAMRAVDTDPNIVRVKRNRFGQYDNVYCHKCNRRTSHRCTYRKLLGMVYDTDKNERICGNGICNICAGEMDYEKSNICCDHIDKEPEEVFQTI